ncbi:MAG: polyhydroxyalkanoate depolymerase [Alphaproteobacteria bacterium]
MIYQAYQSFSDMMTPVRAAARIGQAALANAALHNNAGGPFGAMMLNRIAAACELVARTKLTHARPGYGIESIEHDGKEVAVVEEAAFATPFATLLHFKKDIAQTQPRVLVVAPLSSHFATLLRGTVRTLLAEHDVYITDWHNARDIPLAHGKFGFDEYVEHMILFMEKLGPGGHMVSICQPCAAALAAVSVMAESGNAAQPRSMTLMAGPVDCRVNPTGVNQLATSRSIEWFEENLIFAVPRGLPGAGRRVYPGFVQLAAFMSMNVERHVKSHIDIYDQLATGEREKAEITQKFYDEYFAVLDLPAEFYLETVRLVFQEYALPLGKLEYKGRKVDPKAIRRTALFTVEGEKDDICSVGQTLAAQSLCSSVRPYMKRHHMQAGVGHYGVFSGSKWNKQVYPILRNVIRASD